MFQNRFSHALILFHLCCSSYQHNFFVADKNGSLYVCVTNSSFAMSWITDDIYKQLEASTYIPASSEKNHFDSEITSDDRTRQYYLNENVWSLQTSSSDVVLDRRWEDMKVVITTPVNGNREILNFTPLTQILQPDFEISFSLRTEKEAHIFLCDDANPNQSNCYWFMLEAFGGKTSALRKCGKGNIPSENHVYPRESCGTLQSSLNHSDQVPEYLSSKHWSHFKLRKIQNRLSLIQLRNIQDPGDIVLDWTDRTDTELIAIKHMIVHSKLVNGFWKIHELDYVYTKQAKSFYLEPAVLPMKGEVCISMFVAMCHSCQLKLTLLDASGRAIKEETFEKKDTRWSEIKFLTENNTWVSGIPYLLITTAGSSSDTFWAIDKVRQCQRKEFRMITSYDKEACQLMSDKDNVILQKNEIDTVENDCPENTIGEFCVPCTWIYGNCAEIKICSKSDWSQTRCFCSAGFTNAANCVLNCPINYYGHSCQKRCSIGCGQACDSVDGKCLTCRDGYRGDKCDLPPKLPPIFAQKPQVQSVNSGSVVIYVNNFEVKNQQLVDQQNTYEFYAVQYRKANSNDQRWTTTYQRYRFGEPQNIRLYSLEANTLYYVRCAILNTESKPYEDTQIPFTHFQTTCQDITEDIIDVNVKNTSIRISLLKEEPSFCMLSRYTVKANYYIIPEKLTDRTVVFDNLTPFTNYIIAIKNSEILIFEKMFQTTEGVPQRVENLKVTDISSSSVGLQWETPKIYGELQYYNVQYRLVLPDSCKHPRNSSANSGSLQEKETSTRITNLLPYSRYMISVSAINTKFEGPPSTQTVNSSFSKTIQTDEIPDIKDIQTQSHYATIKFHQRDCIRIKGPLLVTDTLDCIDDWCKKPEPTTFQLTTIILYGLSPFTNYNVTLQFCRSDDCQIRRSQFQTKAIAPNAVRDLLVHSKKGNSVFLRWRPPYPPTGILENYYFSSEKKGYSNKKLIKASVCKLWLEFLCAKITLARNNKWYTITIFAKNKDVRDLGQPQAVKVYTKIEPSDAPYDLSITWTIDNHLKLQWKHPNQSNGEIQYFLIKLIPIDNNTNIISKTLSITENTLNLTYDYTINATDLLPATRYEFKISAYNSLHGEELSRYITSPPDIPFLKEVPQISVSNDTVTIAIKMNRPRGMHTNYHLTLLISSKNSNVDLHSELENFHLQNFRIVAKCEIINFDQAFEFTIGDQTQPNSCNQSIVNPPLDQSSSYNITLVLTNSFQNQIRYKIRSYIHSTAGPSVSKPADLSLLALLILLMVPITVFLFMKRHQLVALKNSLCKDNTSPNEIFEIQETPMALSASQDENTHRTMETKELPKKPGVSATQKAYSKSIIIVQFEEYVKESVENGELERQHALFPRGQTKPWTCGSKPENKIKNRYNNLIAYDHSRIVLRKIENKPHSDYINANYIDGYQIPKSYIATQGPKSSTLSDFWRMIWQENVKHIVMLANIFENGKKKVEKYWPAINESLKFGNITIKHVSNKVHADFEHKVFQISRRKETRRLEQLHFSSWPDHGVPLYPESLVPFLQKILKLPLSSESPLVVHCSAGVGRTGTILLCDVCLRMAAREGSVDVLGQLQHLREQRPNMVDNVDQYKLAHLVILQCLSGVDTSIPCNKIDESVENLLESNGVKSQMQYLEDTQWQDDVMKKTGQKGEQDVTVREKNRFADIIPEIQGRVFISRYPPSDDTSTYINAVTVDGFRCPGRFIVTQQPMPNTLGDFWRLVDEMDVSVIISLNQINPKDKTSCKFWPTKGQMNPVNCITLKDPVILSLECYDVITLHMNRTGRKDHKVIEIFSVKYWPSMTSCPKSVKEFLTFWEDSDAASRKSSTVIVTCYDGVKASGLYVAMSFVIEKMKLEHMCDVCQAVRTVRHNRSQFVQDEKQFAFLYRAAVEYINGFQSYANFN